VADPGETSFLEAESVDKLTFREENDRVIRRKLKPATAEPVLLGITKASLTTQSFISAASFQETTRVLTDAAIRGAKDDLRASRRTSSSGTSSRRVPATTGTSTWRSCRRRLRAAAAGRAGRRGRAAAPGGGGGSGGVLVRRRES